MTDAEQLIDQYLDDASTKKLLPKLKKVAKSYGSFIRYGAPNSDSPNSHSFSFGSKRDAIDFAMDAEDMKPSRVSTSKGKDRSFVNVELR